MTFSVVARSADGRAHGVAVASKFLAVGMAVPAAEADLGALATQSYANLAYRPQGLALLRTGVDAAGVVAGLTAADPGREQRQLGVVGRDGAGATFTGAECVDWAGGRAGDGYAIQGNILAGEQVVVEMERAWLDSDPGAELGDRLLAALIAGDRAGGDRRGRQSAALLVVQRDRGYGGTGDVAVDLRVDDHTDPVAELSRLLELHRLYFGQADPETLLELTGPLAQEVAGRLARLGYAQPGPGAVGPGAADRGGVGLDGADRGGADRGGAGLDGADRGGAGLDGADRGGVGLDSAGLDGAGLDAALRAWAGVENLEERLSPGRIDPLVLRQLRAED